MKFKILLVLLSLFLPIFSYAQVSISEIMYDLSGTDADREWIEVANNGSAPVDISFWKFYEGNTNHSLKIYQGNASFGGGQYAIIADDPAKFLIDWPNFSGNLFDSSFDLSNSGEALVIRDDLGADVDTVSYTSNLGALGDGNSLNRNGSSFMAAAPTPGSSNSNQAVTPSQSQTSTTSGVSVSITTVMSSGESTSESEQTDSFEIDAGKDRLTAVGSTLIFRGEIKGTPRKYGGVFTWSLGDGSIKYGQEVSYNYRHPGDYIVVLNVSNGDERATDRVNVKVVKPEISTSFSSEGVLLLENFSSSEINLQDWKISIDGKTFVFPRDTILKGNGTLVLTPELVGVKATPLSVVKVYYPLGSPYVYVKSLDTKKEITAKPVNIKERDEPKGSAIISEIKDEIVRPLEDEPDQVAAAASVFVVEKPQGFWSKFFGFFESLFD